MQSQTLQGSAFCSYRTALNCTATLICKDREPNIGPWDLNYKALPTPIGSIWITQAQHEAASPSAMGESGAFNEIAKFGTGTS